MDCESYKIELQNKIDEFKDKWISKLEEEYGGDVQKMCKENASILFDDVLPMWELCMVIDFQDKVNNFTTVEDLDKILDA